MSSSRSMSNDEIKHWILNVYAKFVTDVDPNRLSDWLLQEHVISIDQWQKIRHDNPTTQDRCRGLLSHLFSTQHPRAFLVVQQALRAQNHYLLEEIDSQESGFGCRTQLDTETILQDKNRIEKLEKNDEDQKKAWDGEKDRLLNKIKELKTDLDLNEKKIKQLEKDVADQKRAWEADKDRLLKSKDEDKAKMQQLEKDHEDQKKVWEADRDRLLKTQKELETKVSKDKKTMNLNNESAELHYKSHHLIQTIRINSDKKKKSWFRAARESTCRPKCISGITILDKELFVASDDSSEIDVYDSKDFSFNCRLNLDELNDPKDITSCDRNKCLYIFNYKRSDQRNEILRVDASGKLINSWSTGNDFGWDLSVTDESNVILAVFKENKLNEYSPDGLLIRNIILSSDLCTHNITHAMRLTSGHFLICQICICRDEDDDDDLCRVCIVNEKGKLKKSFEEKRGSTIEQMISPAHFSVDANGFVMVVDSGNSRVVLLDSDLQFKREILSGHLLRNPYKILLDRSNSRLLVVDNEPDNHRVMFFQYD